MDPIKLSPAFQNYLWGGTRLRDEYHKNCSFDKVAESWELSCHPSGPSVVASGPDAGKTLAEWIEQHGKQVVGTAAAQMADFPVLIKLIDAKDDLSVQVHPDDAYARAKENENGKTECWVVIDCEPGASLIYGFQKPIDKEEFARRIADNTLLEVLNKVEVHPGDVFFIEAGTIHAIGAGILIAEIQQNSNITYRVSDYGRLGADGKPRALHIAQALDVTKREIPRRTGAPEGYPEQKDGYTETKLASCAYFTVHRLELSDHADLTAQKRSFHALQCLSQTGCTLTQGETTLTLQKGETAFVPAGTGDYRLTGSGTMLLTTL